MTLNDREAFFLCLDWKFKRREYQGGFMRKCIRCGNTMVEGCGIKVKGGAYGIVLTDNENKWWGGRIGEPKVAICPNCGEVSIYLENIEKLRNNEK